MSKLLIVVPRFGDEVIGSPEGQARLAAERSSDRHDVEVATTTAVDDGTWEPYYPVGVAHQGGVAVRRFPLTGVPTRDERAGPAQEGPETPELLEFLHREGASYDAILFWTYVHFPTVRGLPLVPERALLVPSLDPEMPLALAPYRALFALPRAIGFLTPEERDLVHRAFRNEQIPSLVIGLGAAPAPQADAAAFRRRHGIVGPMALCLGTEIAQNDLAELLADWAAFHESDEVGAKLVVAGEPRLTMPARDDVVILGRLSEEDTWAALAAADALLAPSRIASLEGGLIAAAQMGTPVLVPESNAVAAGHVRRSGGGLTYGSNDAFVAALRALLAGSEHGEAGRSWTGREYSLEAFDERLERLVELALVARV